MVIKTVTSFASRPLRWFALLSVPLFLCSFGMLAHTFVTLLTESPYRLNAREVPP